MARSVLQPGRTTTVQQKPELGARTASPRSAQHSQLLNRERLRQRRSREYMQAVAAIDLGGCQVSQQALAAIVAAVDAEFGELGADDMLIGIVAQCRLGEPFEVHTLSLGGEVITHYRRDQALPCELERARGLAASGCYAFIEVYLDTLRAIGHDGSVSVVY